MSTPDYETLLAVATSHHGEASLGHARRVADTAAALAGRFGVPVETARVAGLLHDWARDLSPDELVAEARARGITVAEVDLAVPYLLHARVGRALVAEAFPGIGTEILDAVSSHTCGADEMGDLEKVVYVADMIEPGRDFDGADDLRAAVEVSGLDEAFRSAYVESVEHLVRMRRHLHPDTVAVWNTHVAEERD